MRIPIIIKINPRPLRPATANFFRPSRQLLIAVIMPIPARRPVQSEVDVIRRPHQLVRNSRRAHGAQDDLLPPQSAIDICVPPTLVPELHDVAIAGIELPTDRIQPLLRVPETRRELKEKASHPLAERLGDVEVKLLDEHARAFHPEIVRDVAIDLDAV
jgi:hypothetical protein